MKFTLHTSPKIITPESQEYKNLNKIKWFNFTGLLIIFSIFIGSMWFVYTNIYQTIGKVQILLITNPNLNFEPIDFKLYNDTVATWKSREELPKIIQLRDPFHEVSLTSTTSSSENTPQTTLIHGQL